jgi:regulator of protease activity HflC (stomatin/prohibitin superfamily)
MQKGQNELSYLPRLIALMVVVVIVPTTIMGSIVTIQAGHRGVLLTWGKVEDKILPEGISFVTPYMNQVVEMSVQTMKYSADATSASKDLQDVVTQVTLNYHIKPTSVNSIYQNLGKNYEDKVIQPAIQESVKASTALFTAEELITQRPLVKEKIENAVKERMVAYSINVETISITDFKFSTQFTQAIESKVTAQQQALQAENVLKRIKIEAEQAVAMAEGQAQSRIKVATAEAEAIKIQGDALKNNPELLKFKYLERWNGLLPQYLGCGGDNDLILSIPEGK